MDELSLKAEMEDIMTPGEDDDLDTPDGFQKFIQKQLSKLPCSKGESKMDVEDKASISPSSSRDFQEATTAYTHSDINLDKDVYDFTYPKRGLAVIINNERFTQSKEFDDRPGSSYDLSALYHTFRHLGFDVLPYDDLVAWKMVEVLKSVTKKYDHWQADCFICAILTHGDQTLSDREYERSGKKVRQDLLFGVDGQAVFTKTIIDIFNNTNCPGLAGKPRLFFFQACRGSAYDHGTEMLVEVSRSQDRFDGKAAADSGDGLNETVQSHQADKTLVQFFKDKMRFQLQESFSSSVDPPEYHLRLCDALDAKSQNDERGDKQKSTKRNPSDRGDINNQQFPFSDVTVSPAPLYKDCLIMYATPPGHYAWRRQTGAWFVQSLCKILGHRLLGEITLLKALVVVSGHVAKYYQSNAPNVTSMHEKKEMPVIESRLVKDIFMVSKKQAYVNGHFAWRRKTGAWFMQSLCKMLENCANLEVSLLSVLISVTHLVALEYQSENPGRPAMHGKKETPVIESRLIKNVYLTRKRKV